MQSSAQPFAAWTTLSRQELGLGACAVARHLDDDLVHLRLDGAGELVSLLGEDRERRHEVSKGRGELVDLGRRRVPAGEDTEVDADLDTRLVVLPHEP
jgi:hypothetical protein